MARNRLLTFDYKKELDTAFRFLEILPILLCVTIASFGMVAVTLLLFDAFRNELLWPLGLLAAAITGWAAWRNYSEAQRAGSKLENRAMDMVMVFAVIAWIGFNLLFTSQHVFTDRDPGVYAIAGGWLVNHDSLRIEPDQRFNHIEGISNESAGFAKSWTTNQQGERELHSQSSHMLSALLASVGRMMFGGQMVGPVAMLKANVFIGGAAILAVYALARRFARSYWAAVASGALALSMPFIFFSRDTYTEPLSTLFIFGGSALLFAAQNNERNRTLWLLAGLVFGAATMVRIDGYLTLIIPIVFGFMYLMLKKYRKKLDSQAVKNSLALLPGLLLGGVLMWFDLWELSNHYYVDHKAKVYAIFAALGILVAVGLIGLKIDFRHKRWKIFFRQTRKYGPAIIIIGVIAVAIFLLSRPLWLQVEHIEKVRNATGMLVPGSESRRTHAELSALWPIWYLGLPLAVASLLGIISVLKSQLKKLSPATIAFMAGFIAIMLFYFIKPSIYPDQIWASRRQLPIILPGLAVMGGAGLWWLHANVFRKFSATARPVAIVITTLAVLMFPLITSRPLLFARNTARYHSLHAICGRLNSDNVVFLPGFTGRGLAMPIRTHCNVLAFSVKESGPLTRQSLKEIHRASTRHGLEPMVAFYEYETGQVPGVNQHNLSEFNGLDISFKLLEKPVDHPPLKQMTISRQIYFAEVQADGSLIPR